MQFSFFSLRLGQTFMQDFVDTKFAPLMNCWLQILFESVSERKWYFLTKIVLTYCEEKLEFLGKIVLVIEKKFEIRV